ncbi:MAG: hypothetical protein K9K39_03700 [Desulfohalobiaceae bacterium]|nr:hypothetical protein [Desulfohalobiaceae bacterium]
MSPEEKDRDSESSSVSRPYKDFSEMEEETVREKKRQLAPLFPADDESEEVENVIETSFEEYVLVKHGGVFHMVFYEGETPQLLSWEEVRDMPQLQKWCEDYFD